MTGFQMTGFKLIAAAFALTAAMAMPASSQAQAATGMKVAMAMPMHADGKMVRHGKRHMSHHMAHHAIAKDGDRYGMK
jgi:hypothetical protein